jgi:hypothetical protein
MMVAIVAPREATADDDVVDESEISGARVGCECSWCRELRLRDDDRITYTARDLAEVWQDGWLEGYQSGFYRAREVPCSETERRR